MKDYDILESFCKKIFFVGAGNFWYGEGIGDDKTVIYRIYNGVILCMYGLLTILEILAATIGVFPEDEKRDSIAFAVSHTIVMIKILSIIYNKELIKKLNLEMVSICKNYEEKSLQEEKYRIIKINIIAYFLAVYGSAACFIGEGIRKMYEGSHFVTVVTYYPSSEDNTFLASLFRLYNTLVLLMMLMTMIISVDAFTMAYLIIFKYKIIELRRYFEKLNEDFIKIYETGNEKLAAEQLSNGLIEGIKMHKELLRTLKVIDKAFGTVMALQLCQSSGSAVSLLLQIALSEHITFVGSLKIIFFVCGLFFLLGLFLCNAGEITYQASLLANSIFYCGWHVCPAHFKPGGRKIGQIVLLAYTQAQKPLILKAYKMIELTYGTFLMVIKTTYSVFALFYAQNNN